MSFQNLRANNQIFVLDKQGGRPIFENATVVSVSAPTPKYGQTPNFTQMPEMVVDIVVKIGERTENYQKLPANLDIADSGIKVITTSREAMNSEVMSYKQKSVDALASVPMHQDIVSDCDDILKRLNPEIAEKAERDKELKDLRAQVETMSKGIRDLTALIADLKSEKRSKKE